MDSIITVIIPIYNGEEYLTRAVESVLNQPERKSVKVLLVNDGSIDGSGKLCDLLAQKHPNVRVLHKENGGVSSARNLGLQNVDTKYVAFLDCDDWWDNNFFDGETCGEFAKDDSFDIYQFAYLSMDQSCKLVKRYAVENKTIRYDAPGLDSYDWSHPCSFVYRTDLLVSNQVKYPIAKVGEDGPFVEMALYHAGSLRRINKVLFVYYENLSSCLHTTDILTDVTERYRAFIQEQQYFQKYGVHIDPEVSFVWHIADDLPRICAENKYHVVARFMNEKCFTILRERPDIHFRPKLWNRFDAWRRYSGLYWLWNKVLIGVPLWVKRLWLQVPGLRKVTGYLYNRYHRGFTPVGE